MQNLTDWGNGKRESLPFAIPIVWREGKDHITDSYFCMINLKEINCKDKHYVQYSDVPSAIRPILHGPDLSVPNPDSYMEYSSDSEHSDMVVVSGDNVYNPEEDDKPVFLTQAELSDLPRDLNLSKESVQGLGSRLKEKHLLAPGIMFYSYRDRERELRQFFMFQDEVIIGLLQYHCWIDQINELRI